MLKIKTSITYKGQLLYVNGIYDAGEESTGLPASFEIEGIYSKEDIHELLLAFGVDVNPIERLIIDKIKDK